MLALPILGCVPLHALVGRARAYKPAAPAPRLPCYQERRGKQVDMSIFHMLTVSYIIPSLKVSSEAKRVISLYMQRSSDLTEVSRFPKFIPEEARILIKPFSVAPTFPKRDPGINSYNLRKRLHLQINVGNSGINKATKIHSHGLSNL